MTFAPFNVSKEGDTTFLNIGDIDLAVSKLIDCKASKVHVHNNVWDHLIIHNITKEIIKPTLIPSNNPKLAFIKELAVADTRNVFRDRVEIGQNTIIMDGTQITNTTIGNDCLIYPNCTLGFPALGLERDENNEFHDFKHIGRLEIGNNVVIGQLSNVARGTLDKTVVEDNVRTDAHVNIAHNCHVGYNSLLAVGCVLGGSVRVGHDCWIGLNATIREQIKIGNNALVGMGAVVIRDVPDNDIVAGCPAKSIKHKVTLSDDKLYMMTGYRRNELSS